MSTSRTRNPKFVPIARKGTSGQIRDNDTIHWRFGDDRILFVDNNGIQRNWKYRKLTSEQKSLIKQQYSCEKTKVIG